MNKSAAQTTKTSSSNTSGGDQKTTTTAANSRIADTTDKRTTTCEQVSYPVFITMSTRSGQIVFFVQAFHKFLRFCLEKYKLQICKKF